jgi:MarR family transcriptional regulator, transcriptional regulator for hemolysin
MRASAERHRSPDLDDALAFRIHRTNRLLRTHLARFLDEHEPGLTPEQWFVLARVTHRGPVRQVELAEPVLGDPPNVSRLVDALVAGGYLTRSADPADRRSSLLTLTEHGRARTSALLDRVVDQRRQVFEGFDDGELDALAAALDRIDDNVRRLLAPDPEASRHAVRRARR